MALEGSLYDMSLVDLIQIFRMGKKMGVLVLAGGVERGVIYVNEGRLIDAVLVRGPERQVIADSEEAVIQMLQWQDATFTFRHDLVVPERPVRIFHDGEWLVIEGMRRRTDPLHDSLITLDTRLALTALPGDTQTGFSLDLDQWRILSQVSICQNIREICTTIGVEPQQAIATVTELVAIGVIEAIPAPAPARKCSAHSERQGHTQPALTPIGGTPSTESKPGHLGVGLLNAVMRRVRGL